MEELFPVACGLLIGLLLGALPRRPGLVSAGAAAVGAGILATIVSGEFRISWGFLLIDIPLVAVAIAVAYTAVRARRASPRPE